MRSLCGAPNTVNKAHGLEGNAGTQGDAQCRRTHFLLVRPSPVGLVKCLVKELDNDEEASLTRRVKEEPKPDGM